MNWGCRIAYWSTTIFLALCIGSGGLAEAVHAKGNVEGVVERLGYPMHFMTLLGVWKVLGAMAIVIPKTPRLKEWAYAGIFFNVTGAALSHAAVGDYGPMGFHVWVNIAFALLTIASWALRPPSKIIGSVGTLSIFGSVEQMGPFRRT